MVEISLQISGGKVIFLGAPWNPPWAPTRVKVPWSRKCRVKIENVKLKYGVHAADNHNDTCHTCGNGLLDSNFNEALITNISNFNEFALKFYIYRKIDFF